MITSFRRLVLAFLIGTGFLFSGTIVIPQTAAAQEQPAPKKKATKKTKKTKKSTKKKSKKAKKPVQPVQQG